MIKSMPICKKCIHYQQGFLLPVAIFLMVVLAGIGAYAANLTAVANASSIQDIMGVRAYMAARAGAEWGAMQVLAPETTAMAACPANTTLTINNFNVAMTCTQSATYAEQSGDQNVILYDLTATATQGTVGNTDYISRQIKVTLSRCLQSGVECG